ncbi:MAG: NAD-dependent epimerase/dehydratase family protein [Gemmataceae bacterium]|nr:NAD-dependent epimerase/dehydratase family protein [Gemmataceae bacterium]
MKVLVTGGTGFLGLAACRLLRQRGMEVHAYSRKATEGLAQTGAKHFSGDITSPEILEKAMSGCQAVIHTAAKAGIWGPWDDYFHANVTGTKNVIETCRRLKVNRLVYTSSPSVVFDSHSMEGANESVPYPNSYLAHYPRSKAMAEKMVLAANSHGLATVVLRPHLIWGPGDNHLTPRILEKGRRGKLRRIGGQATLVDSVFIDNAAEAHLAALEKLKPGASCAGKAYFISNGEPWPLWDLVNAILSAGGVPPVKKTISPRLAWLAGCWFEGIYSLLRLKCEPPMTRFLAKELSTSHWFDISAAKRDLGYSPNISISEGLQRLAHWLQNQPKPQS